MNALDAILTLNCQVATALERTARPNLKDVKEARDASKKQTKIADAAVALLEEGIYEVADRPVEDTPLFTLTGDPAPGAEVEDPAPAIVSHPLDGLSEDEALVLFGQRLDDAEATWKEGGNSLKAFKGIRKAWTFAWNFDNRTAFDALVVALAVHNSEFTPPERIHQLHAKYPEPDFENTPLVDLSEIFTEGPMVALAEEIDRCYTGDEERETAKLAWENSFDASPRDTWFAAIAVLADGNLSVDLPDPLPAAPALPVVEAPAAAEGSAA